MLIGLRESRRGHFRLRVMHGFARDQVTGWTGKGRKKRPSAAFKKDMVQLEASSLVARNAAGAETERLMCELDALAIDLRKSYVNSMGSLVGVLDVTMDEIARWFELLE